MKRTMLAAVACASMSLTGCATTGTTTVASTSSQTVVSADALYTAGSVAGGNLVILGKLDKATYQALDMKAYNVLLLVRAGQATIADLTAATTALSNGG